MYLEAMTETTVRDRNQNIIGFIQEDGSGRKTVRNRSQSVLGFYEPTGNVTRDAQSRLFGMGDQTMGLLFQ